MAHARLIYDSPEKNADLYYAAGFWAPDALIFLEYKGKKYLVLSDLELDRAKKEASVSDVLSLSKFMEMAKKKKSAPQLEDVLHEVLSFKKIKKLLVPSTTSFSLVDGLRRMGYRVEAGTSPFYTDRMRKTKAEIKNIEGVQKVVFGAIHTARDVLAKSRIRGGRIIYRGATLTSERLRRIINIFLIEKECVASDSIVACGHHSIDPHDIGSGPLKPHQAIIVDVFPKSQKTLYYGDATRTFCRGHAPDALRKLYATVKEGQSLGLSRIRAGINGKKVHEAITKFFESRGYKTGEANGRQQGFFHSTGHGIGLELHEEPARIGPRDFILKKGYVMSVEPGLYYAGIGGVRIEDLVHITDRGCQILANYPKNLEI